MVVPASPDNTIVSVPGPVIIDSSGYAWGLTASGQVTVNGKVDPTTSHVLTLAFENGEVWQMNADHLWWSKAEPGDAWSPTSGTTVSPLVGVASPNNSLLFGSITSGQPHSLTDANNDHWAITAGGQVALNGVADPTTKNVIALAFENGKLWQENADKLWYAKTNARDAWSAGTASSPIQAGTSNVTYLAGTSVLFLNAAIPVNYAVTTAGDGGDVTFNYQGSNISAAPIKDVMGHLTLNVQSGTLTNYGPISGQGGIGGTTVEVDVGTRSEFINLGHFGINASSNSSVHNILNINVATSVFDNEGVIDANGVGQTITVSANGQAWAPQNGSPYLGGSLANNGIINVSDGSYLFLNAPITGTGTFNATNGSRILFNGPMAATETVQIDASTLEFGAKGTFGNPAMQFLGKISGESASSTILLNGSYGTSDVFEVLSTTGQGLGKLQVFDASHQIVADLTFVGHFQAADFSLTPHAGDIPANNWTSVSFSDHVNTAFVAHSQ